MFYITGDTHGTTDWEKLNTSNFPEQKYMSDYYDFLIIVGDFGGIWDGAEEDNYILKTYNQRNFTTLFIDGNHENHDLLDKYPVEEWNGGKVHKISDRVIHLMRGQVYNIFGTTFFTMGGAESTDKEYRKEGESWWARELPSDEEYEEALRNLETFRYDYYIYKGEVCWFEELHLQKEKNGYRYYSAKDCERSFLGGILDLNMPTPFKPGDIVNIDCYPFGPSFHAMITEAHAQYDCCMPQILFKMPYTDEWRLEALKHKGFYKDAETHTYEPALSPLYRIRYVREDELTKNDELLIRFSKELNGDEEKARAFWDAFRHGSLDGVSVDDVMKAWDAVNSSEKSGD